MANVCVLSTTWYIQDAVEAHRSDGHDVPDEVITHTSPAHFEALTTKLRGPSWLGMSY